MSAAATAANTATAPIEQLPTRLHIVPLKEDLLNVILPSEEQQSSANPIYNIIPTFPENSYGFITVPATTAQALKKKYHGAYLRGSKMRIEEARPHKKRKREMDAGGSGAAEEKPLRKGDKKRSKLEDGVLPAIELPEGRYVKRGWTGGASEKKQGKRDKSTKGANLADKGQVVLRTKPPASSSRSTPVDGQATDKKSKTKSKKGSTIKESERTEHFPSFIRAKAGSASAKPAQEFVEGKGWVNEDGDVVEAANDRKSRRKQTPRDGTTPAPLEGQNGASSTSNTDPEDEASSDESSILSSSSASSVSEDEDGSETRSPKALPTIEHSPVAAAKAPLAPSQESPQEAAPAAEPHEINGQPPAATISSTDESSEATLKPVHPLEALFKRPAAPTATANDAKTKRRPPPAPIDTTFSFGFHADDGDDEEGAANDSAVDSNTTAPPQTPFTCQDRFERGVRSAAPTPDTAAIGRRFSWKAIGGRDEDGDDAGEADGDDADADPRAAGKVSDVDDQAGDGQQEQPEQNEITRIFYEKRGELNRAYKGAKKKAKKEQRQAENRRIGVGR